MHAEGPASGATSRDESSFARGLRVLLAVADRQAIRADVLARELGIPISTLYRYLRALRESSLISEREGVYGLGDRLSGLASPGLAGLSSTVLARIAEPFLESLAEQTGETAVLITRVGSSALCLRQVESRHHIRMAFREGQLLPLHAGAGSRVLLAYAPEELIDALLASELPRYTSDTPDRRKLEPQLATIRATGLATSRGEFVSAAFAIAVPVFQGTEVACSVTLAGLATRCNRDWQLRAKPVLRTAGSSLSDAITEAVN